MDTIKAQREILQKEAVRHEKITRLTQEIRIIRKNLSLVYMNIIKKNKEKAAWEKQNSLKS